MSAPIASAAFARGDVIHDDEQLGDLAVPPLFMKAMFFRGKSLCHRLIAAREIVPTPGNKLLLLFEALSVHQRSDTIRNEAAYSDKCLIGQGLVDSAR